MISSLKIYVGRTCNFHRRMGEHRRGHNLGGRIDRAIKKYGWENFRVDVLEICTEEVAPEREKHWIDKLGTKHPRGYSEIEKSVFPILQAEINKQLLTRFTFAKKLGIVPNAVSAWMTGKHEPKWRRHSD